MDQVNVPYKEYHENYLSNQSGGGLFDVPLVVLPIALLGFNSIYLRCFVGYNNHLCCFLLDFFDVVLPSILFITVLNERLTLCCLISFVLFSITIFREMIIRKSTISLSEALNTKITIKRRPFVTNFKALVSLLSIICILAVDFTIFPKRFIKTEAYGYSLMDTGVGFFIVANALTCNMKESNGFNRKSVINNLPILILGVIRYVSTERINYQKHVTEYGVHWNFFFTLAIVKCLGPYLASKFSLKFRPVIGMFLAHEIVLKAGLEQWVMSEAPRTDLLSANREGIVSLLGYLSLYVLGAQIGDRLLYSTPTPMVREEMKKGACCLTFFVFLSLFLNASMFPSSRRIANPAFIIWIISISLFVLGLSILWESLSGIFCRRMKCGAHHGSTIFILEAIAANNLAFFLIGNLLTGAVNMSMKTLLVPPTTSLFIVTLYVAANTGIMSFMYSNKVTLKCW